MNTTNQAPELQTSEVVKKEQGFSAKRVLFVTLSIAAALAIGFGAYEYWSNLEHQIVKVTGRVTWNGSPVTIGAVQTQHTTDSFQAAIGAFDSEGRFELSTNAIPGAAVGTHKVIVASYGPGMGTTPLVPREYLKATTTPLTIDVSSDPSKNHFELEIVGDKPGNEQAGPPENGGAAPEPRE